MAPARKSYATITCQHCGKDFEARRYRTSGHPSRIGHSSGFRKQRYCSGTCRNYARSQAGITIWLDKNGYPQATIDGKQKAMHRHVMEKKLGRKLLPNETVHHKDGNRANYDESNLELWSSRHGRGQRQSDLSPWHISTPPHENYILGALSLGG